MVLFKINGERNSGTNFIEEILRKNKIPVYVHLLNLKNNTCKYWKHGVPIHNKEIDNDVVDIFIFRDLKEWLVSMYHHSYELEPSSDFKYFLERKQVSKSKFLDFHTNKHISHDDNDKTIFEIRYHKISSILKYSENNQKIVFVSLSYLQQNPSNTRRFIETLCKTYLHEDKKNIISEIPHTTTCKNIKKRKYTTDINKYNDIINSSINNIHEDFVSNLSFTMKI